MRRNGPIWEALKRGGKVAYHGYRRRRLEGKLTRVREAESRAWSGNPTGIPGRVVEVRYARAGRDPGRYVHRFGPNVRIKLGPGRSRVQLYHARGEPIWADERHADYDHWIDVDHKRRHMNPRHRLTRKKARRILHHGYITRGRRKRRLTAQQRKLFGAVASGYHIRRYGSLNPRRQSMRRRRRASSSGGISTTTWVLIGVGAYLWYTGALNQILRIPATASTPFSEIPTPIAAGAPAGP
jgi:hypothetical protein